LQVTGTDEVVPVEDTASLVSANRHHHTFGDAATDIVSDATAPEIMKELTAKYAALSCMNESMGCPEGAFLVLQKLLESEQF
jgi:hypothetical protein